MEAAVIVKLVKRRSVPILLISSLGEMRGFGSYFWGSGGLGRSAPEVGLGAKPPAGSRSRAPGQRACGGKPALRSWKLFAAQVPDFLTPINRLISNNFEVTQKDNEKRRIHQGSN